MKLGDKVRIRRESLGMSQEELALRMGYKSRSSINKIENGRNVSQKIIVRLAEVLDIKVSYLMGWEESVSEEIEQDNDAIANIIVRLRLDKGFLDLVELLSTLDGNKLSSVKKMLETFTK